MLKHPSWILVAAAALLLPLAAGLRGLERDSSVDAFVPATHPAAEARDRARALFGLDDPVIIGLQTPPGVSVWEPAVLTALREIHDQARRLPGVIKADVRSLASERLMHGDGGDLLVDPLLPDGPVTAATAALARERLHAMPMYLDLLASRDDRLLTIIVPVEDPNHATGLYADLKTLAESLVPDHVTAHVAGVAAMNARLATTVQTDTRIFVPAAGLTVLVILLVALRRPLAVLGPLVVIAASAAAAIGLMGWVGAHYYLITTALPVVIMAIAVADSLHLSTWYLRHRAADPDASATAAVRAALGHTRLPITLTTVTTVAAFLGLTLGSAMRPIAEFGLFASVGVAAAWALTLTVLPAIMILTDLRPAPDRAGRPDGHRQVDRLVGFLSRAALAHPQRTPIVLAGIVALMLLGAFAAEFDYERKRYFPPDDPVRLADAALGEALGGLNFLDVVVSTDGPDGILTVPTLAAIAALKSDIAGLPGVVKVRGIDEDMARMHEILTGAPPGTLPTRALAPQQYMFLYEASGAPEDFKQLLDYERRSTLLRAQLVSDRFSTTGPVVEALRTITADWSGRHGLDAEPAGRVAVNHGWMSTLADNHFRGLGFASGLVFVAVLLTFRAVKPALLAMVPVAIGVLFAYAVMGALAIDIAPATSMTAAIATGLGVDFGIHLLAHLRRRLASGATLDEALTGDYLVVGRACFYSAVALGVALAVVCLSSAPPLRWFGLLVSAGAFGSLFGALIMLPGVLALLRPHPAWRSRNA